MTTDATQNSVSAVARKESQSFFQTAPHAPGTAHPLFEIPFTPTHSEDIESLGEVLKVM
jgi:hypothetical protein